MKNFLIVVACMVAGSAAAQPKKELPKQTIDYAGIADRIVGKTANIKEGELVEVIGAPSDMAFLEEIVVAIRKRGAFPLLHVHSESLEKKLLAAVPEKYDTQSPTLALALAKVINVRIVFPPVRDPAIQNAIPAARRAAQAKAEGALRDLLVKRGVRIVELGNSLEPAPSRAAARGMTEEELAKIFWDGLAADYGAIETKGKEMQALLAKGGEVHITHANGTDVKLKIKGRKVLTSDGVISDEDRKAGAINAWLPAGEVFVTPVPGSLEGKIVDDRLLQDGNEVLGLTVEIKAGKITNITAKSGWDAVKARYDAASAGKLEVDVLDIGINPAVKTTAKLESWVSAGTVSLVAGGNVWAGGTNKEPFSLDLHLPGTTVTLDGKPIIENGALK
jgi:leucyl aminopeptidase (aminopeptidase T)